VTLVPVRPAGDLGLATWTTWVRQTLPPRTPSAAKMLDRPLPVCARYQSGRLDRAHMGEMPAPCSSASRLAPHQRRRCWYCDRSNNGQAATFDRRGRDSGSIRLQHPQRPGSVSRRLILVAERPGRHPLSDPSRMPVSGAPRRPHRGREVPASRKQVVPVRSMLTADNCAARLCSPGLWPLIERTASANPSSKPDPRDIAFDQGPRSVWDVAN